MIYKHNTQYSEYYIRQFKNRSFYQDFNEISKSQIKTIIKIKMLESFKQQLKFKINQIKYLKHNHIELQAQDQIVITPRIEKQESEIWKEIDQLQEKIMEKRNEKIELNQLVEELEEQIYEKNRILKSKQQIDQNLSKQIQQKQKCLEMNKSKITQTTNSSMTSVQNISSFFKSSLKSWWK